SAISYLGALLEQLDKYISLNSGVGGEGAGAGVGAGAAVEAGKASMKRAADEGRPVSGGGALDPKALRELIPTEQALLAAKPGEAGPVNLRCGPVTPEQSAAVAKVLS